MSKVYIGYGGLFQNADQSFDSISFNGIQQSQAPPSALVHVGLAGLVQDPLFDIEPIGLDGLLQSAAELQVEAVTIVNKYQMII